MKLNAHTDLEKQVGIRRVNFWNSACSCDDKSKKKKKSEKRDKKFVLFIAFHMKCLISVLIFKILSYLFSE